MGMKQTAFFCDHEGWCCSQSIPELIAEQLTARLAQGYTPRRRRQASIIRRHQGDIITLQLITNSPKGGGQGTFPRLTRPHDQNAQATMPQQRSMERGDGGIR